MITSLNLNHVVANSAYLFSKNDIGYSNFKKLLNQVENCQQSDLFKFVVTDIFYRNEL